MAITLSNRQASPLGVWADPTAYKIAPAMDSATVIVEPTMSSKAIIDLLVKARVISSVDNSPKNTVAPAITGTAQVGQTLTLSNGTWTGSPAPTYTRKWQVADAASGPWVDIASETTTTYSPVAAQVGKFIRGVVTATNTSGAVQAASDPTAAVIAA